MAGWGTVPNGWTLISSPDSMVKKAEELESYVKREPDGKKPEELESYVKREPDGKKPEGFSQTWNKLNSYKT
jgi:hypothetical protein